MELMVTGFLNGLIFLGDIRAQYKSGRTNVDVKVDTFTDVSTKVTVHEAMPHTRAVLNFDVPDHRSGRNGWVGTDIVSVVSGSPLPFVYRRKPPWGDSNLRPLAWGRARRPTLLDRRWQKLTQAVSICSQLFVQYLHPRVAVDSSICLNSSPFLYVAAAVGHKDVLIGGEVGFDTASASFTNYTAGISFNKPDLSAALLLMDKGQTLKASYVHFINGSDKNQVVAEMTHRLSTLENSFSIGSSHIVDPYTLKAKFSDNGKVTMLCQREWRPQSLVTFSAEYDTKRTEVFPKWGLAIDLKV